MNFGALLFHWQMAQPFAVQNLNFEQKRGSRFLFTRFTQVLAFRSNTQWVMEGSWRKNKNQNERTFFMDFSFGKFTSIILVTLSKPLCNIVLNLLTCFYKIIIHITYFWNTWCFLFLSITHYNAYFKDNYLHNWYNAFKLM